MGALVVLAAPADGVEPGSTGTCVVLISNTAAEDDEFDVLVHGPAARWATVEPARVAIGGGEEAAVWVHVAVPKDGSARSGPIEFAVTVASRNDPTFIHAERGEILVAPVGRLRAALEPAEQVGRLDRVRVNLANDGNRALAVEVGIPSAGIDGQSVRLAPGEAVAVDLEVPHRREASRIDVEVMTDAGEAFTLSVAAPDPHAGLRRDLARSAKVLGALLAASVVAVVLVGGRDEDPPVGAPVSVSPTTTAPAGGADTPRVDETPPAPAVAASTATTRPQGSAAPAPDGMPAIVFVRIYGADDRDLVVRLPGRNGAEVRLRSPGSVEASPDLSPDATRVAFVQERAGAWRACVAAVDGREPTCLRAVGAGSSIAWRADGQGLFVADGDRLVELELDASGTAVVREVPHTATVPGGRFALSPDATRVATVSDKGLLVSPIDGGDGLMIGLPSTPEDPVWTAAGDRIVYTADTQIHVTPVGDGRIRQLSAPRTVNGDPAVAGSWVVFRSNRSGNGDLYAVALDGADDEAGGVAQVTASGERDIDPAP